MSGSSAKGRKLPPLLPVEYCRLDRAARMLECETEDLLHWAEIKSIDLWLKLDEENCGVIFFGEDVFQNLVKLRDNSNQADVSGLVDITAGLSTFFIESEYFEDQELENFKDDEGEIGDCLPSIEVTIMCGLWAVEFTDIVQRSNKTEGYFIPNVLYSDPTVDQRFIIDLDSEMRFNLADLLITRAELERLHASISSGIPLKSRYNDSEIEKISRAQMQRASNAKAAAERNSAPRAELVLSLLELVLGEESSLIDNPYALYQRVNKQLREANIIEPEITEQAFADILSKAKSARKDRLKNPS
jgi:hypothetical protein